MADQADTNALATARRPDIVTTAVIVVDTILIGAALAALFFRAVPDANRELVAAVVGFLMGNMVGPARNFLFGTTKGAEQKTTAIADMARASAATAEATPVVVAPNAHVETEVTKLGDKAGEKQ